MLTTALFAVLVQAAPATVEQPAPAPRKVERARLTFIGVSAGSGVTAEKARDLSEYVQGVVVGTGVYDVISSSDIEKILGRERQAQLLGCSESSESCMAEIAGALNSDRLLSGSMQREDDTVIVNLSLIDPKSARVIGRGFRKIESPGGMTAVLEQLPELVYEVVNSEPRLEGKKLSPEKPFGGFLLGVLGLVDFLGFSGMASIKDLPIAPGILVEYSGKRFGVALAVLPKADFGARLEGRFYPFTVKNLFRPHVAVGSTALLSGISGRGALGAALKLGQLNVFLDVGFEWFYSFARSPLLYRDGPAVVAGLGVGWLF